MNTTAVLLLRELRNRRDLWRSAMRDIREATRAVTNAQANAKHIVAEIEDIESALVTLGVAVPPDVPNENERFVIQQDGQTATPWVAAPTSVETAE